MFDRLREFFDEWLRGAGERFAALRVQILAFLVFLLGLLETVDPYALSYLLPERYNGLVLIGVSVTIYLLRQLLAGHRTTPEPYEETTEERRGE